MTAARRRVQALQPDALPTEAMDNVAYWFHPRERRSDATPPKLLSTMVSFWHSKAVSRASGNSGSRDMYRESKKKDAPFHPRRQLTVAGGKSRR
ncbi:unnamed protein product [Ascophyllum nodosum]